MSRPLKFWLGGVVGLLLPLNPSWGASPDPQALSSAEVAAVELAAAYLSHGPSAWRNELQGQGFEGQDGLERLEILLGPPDAAIWRLRTVAEEPGAENLTAFSIEHASGLEDWVLLEIDPQAEQRIVGIRSAFSRRSPEVEAVVATESEVSIEPVANPSRVWGIGFLLAAITLGVVSRMDRRAGPFFQVAAGVSAVAAVALFFELMPLTSENPETPGTVADAATEPEGASINRSRDLLSYRRALAMGDAAAARRSLARVDNPDEWQVVLWRAQEALSQADLETAQVLLDQASDRGRAPMLDLLMARLAIERLDGVAALSAYERLDRYPAVDGWALEVSQVFGLFDLEERFRTARQELEEIGSRDAAVYYHLARAAVSEGLRSRGIEFFERAWQLEPMTRRELLSDFLLAYLALSSLELRQRVDFGSFDDPPVPCPASVDGTLSLPDDLQAVTVGGLLILERGEARVEVPAGCAWAPDGARALDAAARQKILDDRLLRHIDSEGVDGAVGLHRSRLAEALGPLSRRRQWERMVEVAERLETLDREAERRPDPEALRHHATALTRLGRKGSAADKLIQVARLNRDQSRVDPSARLALSEILIKEQEYDRALVLIKTALDSIPFETSGQRLLQVEMEKRLFRSAREHETRHFRIIYPPSRTYLFAQRAGEILETERRRLSAWIPQPKDAPRVDVLLLEVGDFYSSYAGQQILGLFDGRIRVPLGEVDRFSPFIVSVMTHELAHAMIAAATDDRSPHWLHEGLAQHLEMPQGSINPLPGLERQRSRLTFELIESALTERTVPSLVQVGYDQARWTAHYLAAEYGPGGFHRLLRAFKDGADTREAIRRALGKEPEAFDRALKRWALEEAPQSWPSEVIDYDPPDSQLISANP